MPHALRCVALGLLAISGARAQRGLGLGTPAPPNGPATSSQQNSTPSQFHFPQMPAFLSGTVMLEGDGGPADNIPIQRVCGGLPRTVAWTNNKGQFSFQWGSFGGIVGEASDAGFPNGAQADPAGANGYRSGSSASAQGVAMMGCELVASAPGYRSSRVDLSGRRAADNSELGMIILHRIAGVEGTSVSITSLSAPRDARKAWEKGVRLLRSTRPSDTAAAEKQLEKAVDIYPKYANAWLDLGRARLRRRADSDAQAAFEKSIEADDKLVDPYLELGRMAVRRENWPDAARYLDRALTLDPVDYPRLWLEDAVADYHVRNLERAERNAREAASMAPPNRDPRASRLLGIVLLDEREYAGADEALRAYLRLSPNAGDLDQIKAQLREIDSHLPAAQPSQYPLP